MVFITTAESKPTWEPSHQALFLLLTSWVTPSKLLFLHLQNEVAEYNGH